MPRYYINLPQSDSEVWEEVESFDTYEEEIEFAKKEYGADDEGKVCLVSEVEGDGEEEEPDDGWGCNPDSPPFNIESFL